MDRRGDSSHGAAIHRAAEKGNNLDGPPFLVYLEQNPEVGFTAMRRVARVISRRLAAMRLLLEIIIDYERPTSTTPEN
jgi:hypothetical protein